ncbi:class I SAM-dependent methyltransferase [Microbulbifer bruguierae]|uniref:Class I SAM-dependent methyltransferase n=1 Tax=Microbulbifer bruguierae TaxID=3029061 RepID=A0ABY8NCV1_9GAMM|nr:class I SAM-dependent methyltransferase [Microbulbifer bruguierae]WGL16754.1 class I SAM-dependent methyltransferase [Microbulbifer bruguierae]
MITIDPALLNLQPGQRVLDLGCGEGRHAIHISLSDPVDVFGVDLSLNDVRTASERAAPFFDGEEVAGRLLLGVGDALKLPFADNFFDVVICSEVLEHIENYQGVLAEIDRVLKPSGVFAATVPAFFPEWVCWKLSDAYHQVEGGHIRIFREKQLRKNIEAFGHQYFARHKAHALHAPYWWLKCLFWEQDDKPVVKAYHRFLVWDLMQKPLITRWLEKLLNPLLGKSIALYFVKPARSLAVLGRPSTGDVRTPETVVASEREVAA